MVIFSLKDFLLRRVHSTWIFTAVCFGFIVGTVAGRYGVPIPEVVVFLAGLSIVITIARPRTFGIVLAVLCGLVLGVARATETAHSYQQYQPLMNTPVLLKATLAESPTESHGQVAIMVNNVSVGSQSLPGIVRIETAVHNTARLKPGDSIEARGVLTEGFSSIAATVKRAEITRAYREDNTNAINDLKSSFTKNVTDTISEPGASLGIGFVLGEKRALPDDLVVALQITGLTHIVVASGYNVSILVRLARRLFARYSKYLATFSAAGLAGLFVLVSGFSPSMVRAALVAGLSLWAWYVGRRFHPITLLMFVATLTLLYRPEYAWGDVGWQLSFAAFFGVMILAPLITYFFYGEAKPGWMGQVLLETLSAQLATAPIIAYVFGQFSVIALLANMMIVPFVPFAMLFIAIVGFGMIGISDLAAIPADWMLTLMVKIIDQTSVISWAQVSVNVSSAAVLAVYICMTIATIGYVKLSRFKLRQASIVE